MFFAIVAMSENRVIGNQGKIPWHLPEDFRWFRHKTLGGTLIMGRKTYESIGKPLPGRETVVMSNQPQGLGVKSCSDLLDLDSILSPLPRPYWICGVAEIYRQLLIKCEQLYLTRVKKIVLGDAYFPAFYEDDFERSQTIHDNEQFRVERWINKKKKLPYGLEFPAEAWPFPEDQRRS